MKMERISDTQIKFTLSKSDLDERNIQISELVYGSEKTHRLFHEILHFARMEHDFQTDENTSMMAEAIRAPNNHVAIVFTKITHTPVRETQMLKPPCCAFRQKAKKASSGDTCVYAFAGLDEAALAAKRVRGIFLGESRLYKNEGGCFLVLRDAYTPTALAEAETFLQEYGQRQDTNYLGLSYLAERAEVVIDENAVEKLANYAAYI